VPRILHATRLRASSARTLLEAILDKRRLELALLVHAACRKRKRRKKNKNKVRSPVELWCGCRSWSNNRCTS
jgi:ATP phosphoribosyltransferase regulatory subunit HisZ